MAGHRALTIALAALALICAAAVLPALAPAPLLSTAQAHPEPNDVDGDEVLNELDNCPNTPNGSQLNTDNDAEGDNCDADDDNDGVADTADNCRLVPNPGQENTVTPGDNRGDACPPVDSDLDGLLDDDDNCDFDPNPDQVDLDGDDKGDACDRDDDNDKYDDGFDNCPRVYNPLQDDLDNDGLGSGCDAVEFIAGAPGSGGSGPGTSLPGAPGAPGAGNDTRAPVVTVTVARRQSLTDTGSSLVVTARCSEACGLRAEVFASAPAARRARLGARRVVLARGSWSLSGAGRTYVFARWTATARRLRAGRRLAATLRVIATDPAGNRRTVSRSIDLRR